MITIAIAMAFFYLAQQNLHALQWTFGNSASILPPQVFGLDWRRRYPSTPVVVVAC